MDQQKIIDRRALEQYTALQFIDWLHANRPLTAEYDYQLTIHNRLSPTPTVAVYLVDKRLPKEEEVLGGIDVDLPANWDILDAIRYLRSEAEKGAFDLRDFLSETKNPEA